MKSFSCLPIALTLFITAVLPVSAQTERPFTVEDLI